MAHCLKNLLNLFRDYLKPIFEYEYALIDSMFLTFRVSCRESYLNSLKLYH